jgi:hypothetical protein
MSDKPAPDSVPIAPVEPDSTNFKEAVNNTFKMPKAFSQGDVSHPDKKGTKEILNGLVPLGDAWSYNQYNNEVNKVPTQAPYWPNAETNEPPGLVSEKAATANDIKESYVGESATKPQNEGRVHLTDLIGSAKLVYKPKK